MDLPSFLLCGVGEYAAALRHSYGLRRAKREEGTGFPVVWLWTSFNSASHVVSQLISQLINHCSDWWEGFDPKLARSQHDAMLWVFCLTLLTA